VCRVPAAQSPKCDDGEELVKTFNRGKMTMEVTRLLPFTAVVMLALALNSYAVDPSEIIEHRKPGKARSWG
jgi:hypothetical protein